MTRRRIVVGVSAAALVVAATAAPRAQADPPECERAVAWAEANAANLPTSFSEFSKHSRLYRLAIYSQLPLDVRASLWREQIEKTLATVNLTPAQVAYLRDLAPRMGDFIGRGPTAELKAEWARAREILGDDIAKLTLTNLGGYGDMGQEACSCNIDISDCPTGYACTEDSDGCDVIDNYCGPASEFMCDGECRKPHE